MTKDTKRGMLLIVISILLSSTIEIVLKIFSVSLHPFQIIFWKFLLGAVVLLPAVVKHLRQEKFTWQDFWLFQIMGIISVSVGMCFYQYAIYIGEASTATTLYSCNPALTLLFSAWFLSYRPTKFDMASLGIYFLGIVCILYDQEAKAGLLPSLLTLAASAGYGAFSVYGKKVSHRFSSPCYASLTFFFGCAQLLLFTAVSHIPVVAESLDAAGISFLSRVPLVAGLTWETLPGLCYLGFVTTGLGYVIYLTACNLVSPFMASITFFFKPILGALLAVWILQERLSTMMIVAICIILVASAVKIYSLLRSEQKEGHAA